MRSGLLEEGNFGLFCHQVKGYIQAGVKMACNPDGMYMAQNAEVMYSHVPIITVDRGGVNELLLLASQNQRKRVRLCAHKSSAHNLHEMIIVHEKSAYVRPHRHVGKIESMHIISGTVDVIIFDDHGNITRVIEMGEFSSGKSFYYRMDTPLFHTLLIRSEVLVFHETTNGPFNRSDATFAPWSPDGSDINAINIYMTNLNDKVRLIQ
jgi:cupin fold WbuC family metalloprotein